MFTVSTYNNVYCILNNWCICRNTSCGWTSPSPNKCFMEHNMCKAVGSIVGTAMGLLWSATLRARLHVVASEILAHCLGIPTQCLDSHFLYTYIYIYIYTHMYAYISLSLYIYIHIFIYIYIYISVLHVLPISVLPVASEILTRCLGVLTFPSAHRN